MLPINCGTHDDYQNFVTENLRKYYPDPDAFARSTWDIIECFWSLDLSYTGELMQEPKMLKLNLLKRFLLQDYFLCLKIPRFTLKDSLISLCF